MAAQGSSSPLRGGRVPALAKYEVLEEIGHGGMATVYRAHDPRFSRDVAAKVIHPHLRDSAEAKHRFHVEAKAVAKLRHPNIVEVYDISDEAEPEQYLVVELVRGDTLRKLLEPGPLPPEVAAALAIELLSALAHAHAADVVHRDIKPENVMLEHHAAPDEPNSEAKPGDRVLVKLTDFGIAKLLDAQGVTSTGQVLGSPAHMAPEQIEGADVDGRADVFGLGVLLYECMVGHLPFEGKNPAQVLRRVLEGVYPSAEHEQPKIGKRWSALLDKALARLPDDRFPDAVSMKAALVAELKLLGVDAPRTELEVWFDDPTGYSERRNPGLIGKLCDLGREARARGSVLDAAAHFNRALAYAPHDPALLKIVAAMHRERRSRDFVKRLVPVVLVSAALGTGAFFVTRVIKHRSLPQSAPVLGSALPVARPSASSSPAAPVPTSFAPLPRPRVIATAPVPHPPKPIERQVTIGATHPSFGLLLAIDGVPQGEAHEGLALTLDGKAHDLTFSCKENECVPLTKNLPAGDDTQITFPVHLNVKPASLVVDGNAALDYGLEEFPSIPVRVGVAVSIPIPYGNYAVHVIERTSGRHVTGTLKPGREVHVSFADDTPSP